MTITVRSVFEEDGKLYPQVFLDDTLYELNVKKLYNATGFIFQKRLMLLKQNCWKDAIFVIIGVLKILVLSMRNIFAMVASYEF